MNQGDRDTVGSQVGGESGADAALVVGRCPETVVDKNEQRRFRLRSGREIEVQCLGLLTLGTGRLRVGDIVGNRRMIIGGRRLAVIERIPGGR